MSTFSALLAGNRNNINDDNNNNKTNGFSVRCLEDSTPAAVLHTSDDIERNTLLEGLFAAYFAARRNKRHTINALAFELRYEENLFRLHDEIAGRTYAVAPGICFINRSPVLREIFAADFRDRVVHHLVFSALNPAADPTFINDSYSCRKERGTHYGIRRVRRFISQCTENFRREAFVMKLDIEGYFMRMDRELLYQKVLAILRENPGRVAFDGETLRFLLERTIFNDPTKNCRVRGRMSDWEGLPATKSLFQSGEGKGFPIGNLTSQLFGNVYLSSLDHFIKEKLGIRYYGRYVDDLVLIHRDRRALLAARDAIDRHLRTELMLNLHPRKFYLQPCARGVAFLGVYLKPFRAYIGKRCKSNFHRKITGWNRIAATRPGGLSAAEQIRIRDQVNSYLGMMSHYQTYRLRRKLVHTTLDEGVRKQFRMHPSIGKISLLVASRTASIREYF